MQQPFLGGFRRQRLVEEPIDLVAVFEPVLERPEPRVTCPFRPPEPLAQHRPEFFLVAHDEDKTVRRAVELARHQRGVRRTRLAGLHMPRIEIPGREISEVLHRGIEEADIEVAALAALARRKHPRHQRERGEEPGHQIDDRQPHARGRPVRLAGQGQIAGLGLHQIIIAGPMRARAVAAIGREMRADDLRIGRREIGVGQPELRWQIAAQIIEQRIRARRQPVQHLARRRLLQIEGETFFVAVEAVEELAVVALVAVAEKERADAARHVAAIGRVLDLDDFRAEIGQLHRAVRPRAILLDRNHAQAGKHREHHHTWFRAISWRAMMMRCNSLVPSPMTRSGASR